MRGRLGAVALFALALSGAARAEDGPRGESSPKPEDEVPTRDLRAKDDANQRYFLMGPKEGEKGPKGGFKVLLVMPGGDGSADFRGFVGRIRKHALSAEWIVAQLVSVKWTPGQQVVWPTQGNPVAKSKFTTEDFAKAVVEDVAKRHAIDAKHVYSLSWSSGGPAAYALALADRTPVRGSYVAMSVYEPDLLPARSKAKGKRFLVDHSPDDKVCPFRTAEAARDDLRKAGAKVRFTTYDGGHGWHGDVFGRLKAGVAWLEGNDPE